MPSSNRKNNRSNFDKVDFDKTMEQFIDVGRQFVDGVSGARPGRRRPTNLREFSKRNANNMRKWVNNKVDSFFDEDIEDDWNYEKHDNQNYKLFNQNDSYIKTTKHFQKRALEAISLRQSDDFVTSEPKQLPYSEKLINQDWPEDSDFQVNRWRRSQPNQTKRIIENKEQEMDPKIRKFPKSRRRRI